ncbi:MAG: phosphoesterase [Aquabacterium sp.]|jgi:hypothetical protein|nr:MAG: phosphoesterase [Aquabacterium sp.]
MRLQILSDLHLETEDYEPQPAPGAELLVLAGDIDATWAGFERFRGWPVPVLYVAGNHEFDNRDVDETWTRLRERTAELGWRMLERESWIATDAQGRRIRFAGTVRWCDFDLFEDAYAQARHHQPLNKPLAKALSRERVMKAGSYFANVMRATRGGEPFDTGAVREEALACRAWLEAELKRRPAPGEGWERTVVITHFGPSLRSADPRYGAQPGTASFCNADDALLPLADLWIHGHLHCRHDWRDESPIGRGTRVVSNARGHGHRGEAEGYDGLRTVDV